MASPVGPEALSAAAGAVGPADLNVALSEYFPVPELQMNEARDFMAGSGAAIATGRQINLFAKVGDSYGVADLEGYWKIAGYAEQIGSDHLAEKVTGVLQLNGAGEVVDASWIAFGSDPVEEIPAGTAVQIDASGSFDPELGVEPSMQLAAGKTLAGAKIGGAAGKTLGHSFSFEAYILSAFSFLVDHSHPGTHLL